MAFNGWRAFGALLTLVGFSQLATPQNAPSNATKFYASVVVLTPGINNYPNGERVLAIGLHPSTASIAKANACGPLSHRVFDTVADQCDKNSVTCSSGGYFAAANFLSIEGQRTWENGYGIVCGKKTLEIAQRDAIAACEKVRQDRGLPDPIPSPTSYAHKCRIDAAGLNDGMFNGKVFNFIEESAASPKGRFLMKMQCWGAGDPAMRQVCI